MWVTLFYSDIESAVVNNGFVTKWFKPSKGVRQGCPLSPYLFVMSTEILSNKIRQNTDIKGITVFENEMKISQFADDTSLFCTDMISPENALVTVKILVTFRGYISMLRKRNYLAGKWETNKTTPLNLKWLCCPIKVLGIYVSYGEKKMMNIISC